MLWALGVTVVLFGTLTLDLWWGLRRARLEAYEGILLDKRTAWHSSLDSAVLQHILVIDTGAGKPLTRLVDADTYARAKPGDRVVKRSNAKPRCPGP